MTSEGFLFLPFPSLSRHPPRLPHQAQSTSHQAPTGVGYQELGTVSVGRKMVTPTFLNISESNKVSLADLKVTGYVPPSKNNKGAWINGCSGGSFLLSKLNSNGIAEANYYWIDFGNSSGPIGPGWFADALGTPIEGGAASIKFDSSVGFWTAGSGYSLIPAGAVNPFDIAYKTVSVGRSAVGNPTPVDLTLADLTVTGYTPPSKNNKGAWINGCSGGSFLLSKLNSNGIAEENYYWIDFGNSSGPIGPGWFADALGTPIEGGADKVVIPAGQAYWTAGSGYTLNFPAPELDAKKED